MLTENTITENTDIEDLLDLYGFTEDIVKRDLKNTDEVGFDGHGILYLGNKKNWGTGNWGINTFIEGVKALIDSSPESIYSSEAYLTEILSNGKTEHTLNYWNEESQALYVFVYYTDTVK